MNIEKSVEKLQNLFRAGDVTAVRSGSFARNAALSGEGGPTVVSGEVGLLEALKSVIEMTPKLTIKIHASQQLNTETIQTWLQWTSPSPDNSETLAFRSLTVWVREDGDWKIAGDMYVMGSFDA